jgi:Zn-finger nucleic acid-binding protein
MRRRSADHVSLGISMNCPNCGAAMRLKDDADYLLCDYCLTPHFPDPNADGVRVLGVPAGISCPICAVLLLNASIARERMFYCERCREVSVDAARLTDWKDLDRRIRCPKCGATMDTHPYCGPGNIIIDSCENCSQNWLDYGELDRVVRAPDPAASRILTS